MNIDKAIEILKLSQAPDFEGDSNDFYTAIQLGIEALTAIRDFRNDWSGNRFHALPGETDALPLTSFPNLFINSDT